MNKASSLDSSQRPRPELFFGLVGALGADLELLEQRLTGELHKASYHVEPIRLSALLREFRRWEHLPEVPYDCRIQKLQDAGNLLRKELGFAALAEQGVGEILLRREELAGRRSGQTKPLPDTAYIIRSLKHPAELNTLRRLYGPYFFVLSAYAPRDVRRTALASRIAQSRHSTRAEDWEARAQELIQRDQSEVEPHGQHVREAFPEADAFFDVATSETLQEQVTRFVEILFGHPFHTPTRREFGMFHARASALRSADLSRQVGAVIATKDGNVIAVGTNEVPKPGGGLYWTGDAGDSRDFQRNRNASLEMRRTTFAEVLSHLQQEAWLNPEKQKQYNSIRAIGEALIPKMKGTRLMGLGEFGRTVHAEMAALMDAARRGVSVAGNTLYTTTFPCHNCTRHIIASGIRSVIYIEPYPKSLSKALHRDAIAVDSASYVSDVVAYEPFVGVAPRRYMEFFRMVGRREEDGSVRAWRIQDAVPRFSEEWVEPLYPSVEEDLFRGLKERMASKGFEFVEAEREVGVEGEPDGGSE